MATRLTTLVLFIVAALLGATLALSAAVVYDSDLNQPAPAPTSVVNTP